jgi:hypothetical protein
VRCLHAQCRIHRQSSALRPEPDPRRLE